MPTLLPPSSTDLQYALEATDAERLDALSIPHRTLWSADDCPTNLLPWLAWAVSVDVWRDSWPESVKRDAIRNAPELHRLKGTAAAVKQSVAALGADIQIVEWFQMEPMGTPYTFAATFTPSATLPNDIDFQNDVIASIDATKPLRSSFTLTVEIPKTIALHSQPILRTGTLVKIGNADPAGAEIALPLDVAISNPDAEISATSWAVIAGQLTRIDAPYDFFAPGVFSVAAEGYTSAYQDWLIPLRVRTAVRSGSAQLEYSYWTSDTANAQLCIECFGGDGESLGVYIPDAVDDGISQINSTVAIPAATNVIRFLQQYDAEADTELFIDLITATLNKKPEAPEL